MESSIILAQEIFLFAEFILSNIVVTQNINRETRNHTIYLARHHEVTEKKLVMLRISVKTSKFSFSKALHPQSCRPIHSPYTPPPPTPSSQYMFVPETQRTTSASPVGSDKER